MCRCTLFGSRAQLCVNPRVKRLTGQAQLTACDGEVKSQACRAGVNIEGRKDVLASIADIEDIVRMGTMKSVRTSTYLSARVHVPLHTMHFCWFRDPTNV